MANGKWDTVLIEGLAVETVIGVYDWEREVTQRLLVDLELAWDNSVPGASDDVADALDYAAVSERVSQCLQTLQPELLERAAEEVARLLQGEFGVRWLLPPSHPASSSAADERRPCGVPAEGERVRAATRAVTCGVDASCLNADACPVCACAGLGCPE